MILQLLPPPVLFARTRFAGGALAVASIPVSSGQALAHASERGHVLLLPTHYHAYGGALAVALSFLLLAFLPAGPVLRMAASRLPLVRLPFEGRVLTSFVSLLFLAGLLYAGLAGSRDPLSNPLPLTIWTLLWVGMTLAQGLFGNLWAWLNPWYGPWRLWIRLRGGEGGPFTLPSWLGVWPAFALLFSFAWFELVYPAPDDPERLAIAVLSYWLFTAVGILAVGYRSWVDQAELLTVFFGMIARLSVFQECRDGEGGLQISLGLPAGKLMRVRRLAASGIAFLLLALSSVSFDGFMRTFSWLSLIGLNPLEFPGRSALVMPNTLGLAAMFLVLCGAFLAAVWLGERLARGTNWRRAAGHLVWSIIPIALAYHFSHYLVTFAVNGQYALAALSDPLASGWNLFGTADIDVRAGVALGAHSAWIIWNLQAAAIIGGHVLAVIIAHLTACRLHGTARLASISQIPLAVLMVAYTVFGLWLLSTPAAG